MSIPPGELGARVRTAREARGLSQKQLADLAGIGKTAMFDLEHGNPGVRLNTLMAVLDILGMSLRLEDLDTLDAAPAAPAAPAHPSEPEPDSLPSHLL
ncbi:MAG: helix-turn-helix transcriptional regulator [Verrucomicrobia bacterium]|nr:helix-turn-helix transcriptional regulator [Verrucomicrobiota bacterium]MCH8526562.1 helix-turn-helix domain-containing protein [Kiritimatiellia bacterium]